MFEADTLPHIDDHTTTALSLDRSDRKKGFHNSWHSFQSTLHSSVLQLDRSWEDKPRGKCDQEGMAKAFDTIGSDWLVPRTWRSYYHRSSILERSSTLLVDILAWDR